MKLLEHTALWLLIPCMAIMFAACDREDSEDTPQAKRLETITWQSYDRNYGYNAETGGNEWVNTEGWKVLLRMRWTASGLLTGMRYDWEEDEFLTVKYEDGKVKRLTVDRHDLNGKGSGTCTYEGERLKEIRLTWPWGWESMTLSYNTLGEVVAIREESSEGWETNTTLEWNGGNVVRETQVYTNPGNSYERTTTYDYLYDDHKSAFEGLDVYALMMNEHYLLSGNNAVRIIVTRDDFDSDTTVYSYTYKNGCPVTQSRVSRTENHETVSTGYLGYTDGSGATEPQTYSINVTTNLSDPRNIYLHGVGVYEEGLTVALFVEPYHRDDVLFVSWDDGSTDNPRIVTVHGDATYVALFEQTENKLKY